MVGGGMWWGVGGIYDRCGDGMTDWYAHSLVLYYRACCK